MDFDRSGGAPRRPAMALAVATIVAAGVTGMAVAGLAWAFDAPFGRPPASPPDGAVAPAFERTPEPAATGTIDTPGWDEALGLPGPASAPPAPVDGAGAGAASQPDPTGNEEVRSRPVTRHPAAARPAPATPTANPGPVPSLPGAPDPIASGATSSPAGDGTGDGDGDGDGTVPGTIGPATDLTPGFTTPGAVATTPTALTDPTTGAATRGTWAGGDQGARRRAPANQPRQQPAGPDTPPWGGGPFNDFRRFFPW